MNLKTVGDLRKLIRGLPDEMELNYGFSPDVVEQLLDSSGTYIKEDTYEFTGVEETRCDDIPRLYLTIDVDLTFNT